MIATENATVVNDRCLRCHGLGSVEDRPDVWEPCADCDGTGTIQPAVALNVRKLNRGLRNQFKAFCAQHSMSMEDMVIVLMEKAVDRKIDISCP